ncbi:MAG: DUF4190 domain-containing protein [Actinomycetota bacterium]
MPPAADPDRTDGRAIAALVFGILGITALPIVGSVIAVWLGITARRRIDADERIGGRELASAGVVLGWVGVGIWALVFGFGLGVGLLEGLTG